MDLKISVKTILLFAALFILGTMILGFYSCSGSSSPLTPQVLDDAGPVPDTSPVPGTISDDGITTTTPVIVTTDESGTIVYTYDLIIDESGVITFTEPRDAQVSGYVRGDAFGNLLSFDGFDVEFSAFTEAVPGKLSGTVTWTNNAGATLKQPRIALWIDPDPLGAPVDDQLKFYSANIHQQVDTPDILCSAFTHVPVPIDDKTPIPDPVPRALPCIFVADADENYELLDGQSAVHPLSFDKVTDAGSQITIYIIVEIEPAGSPGGSPPGDGSGEGIPGATTDPRPTSFAVTLIEDAVDPISVIEVVVTDPNHLWNGETLMVEETVQHDFSILIFDSYVGGDTSLAKFTGIIKAKPSVDSPFDLLVSFVPPFDENQDNYFWMESF